MFCDGSFRALGCLVMGPLVMGCCVMGHLVMGRFVMGRFVCESLLLFSGPDDGCHTLSSSGVFSLWWWLLKN
jgi:hypothetical protein